MHTNVEVISFSGGLDSAFLTEIILRDNHHVVLISSDFGVCRNKASAETAAQTELVNYYRAQYPNQSIRHIVNDITVHKGVIGGGHRYPQAARAVISLLEMAGPFDNAISFNLAYLSDDHISNGVRDLSEAYSLLSRTYWYKDVAPLKFPLIDLNKGDILSRASDAVLNHFWTCERPHTAVTACHVCPPCRKLAGALCSLYAATSNENKDPWYRIAYILVSRGLVPNWILNIPPIYDIPNEEKLQYFKSIYLKETNYLNEKRKRS